MILGTVSRQREAVIQLAAKGSDNRLQSIRAIVDTGYTGYLMLPRAIVADLAWQRVGFQPGILGDGSLTRFEVCFGMIIWDGVMREIEVNISASEALIGMSLLDRYKIEIEAFPDGDVRLTAIE